MNTVIVKKSVTARSVKPLLLLCLLPTFLAGCSLFQSSQPPAPVYRPSEPPPVPSKKTKPLKIQKKLKPVEPIITPAPEPETLQTIPLGESRSEPAITAIESPQSVPLTFEQEQALLEQELRKGADALKQKSIESAVPPPVAAPVVIEPPPPPPPPPPEPPPPPFQPLETFAPFSPVVGSLVVAANQTTTKGNTELATTTIERAIRIEPRNAALFYKLALLRLKQAKPALAEDLAKKSALLATNDNQLKKHSWLLIARAREMRDDKKGGKAAREMADKF